MKCYGCGIEKDISTEEVYPYPEDDTLSDKPLPPLFVIECESVARDEKGHHEFRVVVVCHHCFHKLQPDMWIGENCWNSINPVVSFDKLPFRNNDDWQNPEMYPNFVK